MSLKIRLSRGGAKKHPFYRIVIADSRSPRDGRYVERVGTFNPMVAKDHDDRLKFDADRIKYWLSVGARPTDRVARFLSQHGLVDAPVRHDQTKQHLPRKKTLERLEAKAEEDKAKAEAAEQAAEQAAAAPAEEAAPAEAPAEEAAAEVPAEEAATEEAPVEEAPVEEAPAEAPAEEEAAAEEVKEEAKTDG